jgi:hypothetical protein
MGNCFCRGPVLGNLGGCSFPRAFERRVKLLFIRKIQILIEEFERHVREDSGNRQLSPKRPRWATWRVLVYWEF